MSNLNNAIIINDNEVATFKTNLNTEETKALNSIVKDLQLGLNEPNINAMQFIGGDQKRANDLIEILSRDKDIQTLNIINTYFTQQSIMNDVRNDLQQGKEINYVSGLSEEDKKFLLSDPNTMRTAHEEKQQQEAEKQLNKKYLNNVAQEEINETKKRFTKNEPIYEERTKKLFGFVPIGKEKVFTDSYAEVFTNKTAENYVNALSRFMNNPKKAEDDLLKIAEHHKDIFTPNLDVKEFIKNKIKDEIAYQEGEKQGGDDGREHLTREHTLPNTFKDMKRAKQLEPKPNLNPFGPKPNLNPFGREALENGFEKMDIKADEQSHKAFKDFSAKFNKAMEKSIEQVQEQNQRRTVSHTNGMKI